MASLDLGVLISGRGSNLQAILDAAADGSLPARVRVAPRVLARLREQG